MEVVTFTVGSRPRSTEVAPFRDALVKTSKTGQALKFGRRYATAGRIARCYEIAATYGLKGHTALRGQFFYAWCTKPNGKA